MFFGKNNIGDRMEIRTDLISEENLQSTDVKTEKREINGIQLEITDIKSKSLASRLKKPCGKYCTIRFGRLDTLADTLPVKKALLSAMKELLQNNNDNAMIVGLGNSEITPDALGPMSANMVIATRHISGELKEALDLKGLHSVSCLTPGVLGKTGIEAFDIIKATVSKTKPDIVVAIDALAARTAENLCRTIQITDSGIAPGSGVKNERKELSEATLGVPVIALGIPTVIDANCLLGELNARENLMVTPKEIDLLINKAAAIISRAINMFFQPALDEETIESLS